MRALVLHAHPVETSYNAALHRLIIERLSARGYEIDDCDLYAEGFDPRLTREERLAYHDIGPNLAGVSDYVERLRRAEALILSFPVWNFGYPAILKGFFDRVFVPGVAFRMVDGKVETCLDTIRKVGTVTTYGGPRWRAFVMGDPPRKLVTRLLRATVKPGAPFTYLAHYDMNRSTDATRATFMRKVSAAMDRF
ncbi:NAD(P)H-dependent oxidoreductase [Mesorhizobium sp. J428]|uniref:NAD(P)H-dependent oxidoreductase n=1 Tax=Mesorhizobium sp. J428 TaxID=2898440 RepID=UPI002151AFAD|nr:NAD(P)H-dependent oxidoreductase [Mesorhizobium sp. J428]MCR5855428.1 NAD(P)H-dependent oxidoreductase [Mesorhizobium sp. J428]